MCDCTTYVQAGEGFNQAAGTCGSGQVWSSAEKARAARAMPAPSRLLNARNMSVNSSCSCRRRCVTMPTSSSTMLGRSHFSGICGTGHV